MKKLALFLLCCYGITGCVHNQNDNVTPQKVVALPEPSIPFELSLNRELYYQSDDMINASLFSLKDAFLSQKGDFNRSAKLSSSPAIHNVISRGFALLGSPYRYGGQSVKTGFDCSGFVSYLFREQAGVELPRSTSQMIKMDAPKVAQSKLKPGDVLFFATGRGRNVSHTGIYIGNDYFIHSASERKGVRIDSLNTKYWKVSFLEAKRVLN